MTPHHHPAINLLALKTRTLPFVLESPPDSPAPAAIERLTRGLAGGDEESFCEFHRLYFDRLYHYLLAVSRGDEHQAREALQETFVRVARHARVFHSEDAFYCWLRAVARNIVRDSGRKTGRYIELLRRFALFAPLPASAVEPGKHRASEALAECLEALPAADRELIEQRYMRGETIGELAAALELTEKSIESRLLRLRRKLREDLMRKLKNR